LIGGASAIGLKPIFTASITGPGQQPFPGDAAGDTTGGTSATGRGMGVDLDRRRGGRRAEADLYRQYYRAGPATVSG